MQTDAPICVTCKHYRRYDDERLSCDAFPEGIPEEILTSEVSHKRNVPRDGGIKYEEGTPQEFEQNA